jgi:hypothetical protein
MSFLNPLLLFGMTAVSVPIIIHLLNRRKFERVVWAAMRFLQASVRRNQRRLRIEDLLLLLVRCLLLLFLALAAARPALRAARGAGIFGSQKVVAVLILDNSYSMSQTDGAASRFEKAKSAELAALDRFPTGSTAAVLLASDFTDPLIPEPTVDINLARKAIQDARLCDRGSDLMPAIHDAIAILRRKVGPRREIYLATDGQAVAWRQMDGIIRGLDEVKDQIRAHVLLVGNNDQRNLGVSNLRLASEIPAASQPLRFSVEVTNFGPADVSSVRVTIRVDGKPPSDEATIDTVASGKSRSVSLFARLMTSGYHTVTASIDPDHLPADDSRTLVVRAVDKASVLLVDGNPSQTARDTETFFLRHALVPVAPADAPSYFIKATVTSADALAAQRFDDYDTVVLADVADLPPAQVELLAAYVRRGNGLIIFPGPHLNADFYNTNFYRARAMLPAEFSAARGDPEQDQQFVTFSARELSHPIVSMWQDPANGDPSKAHFYRSFTLVPPVPAAPAPGPAPATTAPADESEPGPSTVVVRFSDGSPAIAERSWGLGRVVQFASSASTRWNDLPAHAGLYVPLVRRTLGWLLGQQDRSLNVSVGEPIVFNPPGDALGQDALIHPPAAAPGPSESRRVELVDHVPTVKWDQTNWAGVYSIEAGGRTAQFGVQQTPLTSIDDSESNLTALSPEQLTRLGQSAHVVPPGGALGDVAAREQAGTELGLGLVGAALLMAMLETFLAEWFSRPK